MGFGMISYVARAYRWALLLEPLGYQVTTFRSFVALMIGYFANLLVPRMGEITRCGILKKTDNVELTSSFGTVVAERTIDLICLFVVIFLGFIIEFKVLSKVLTDNFQDKILLLWNNKLLITLLIVVLLSLAIIGFFLFKKYKYQIYRNPLMLKFRSLIRSLLDGFLSVRKLKTPFLFWISTLVIWVMYFLMTYEVFFAFEPTMHLGVKAGIIILIVGGLGMATPVQGGVGAFHLFVSGALIMYGISESNGEFFAFVLHTSQFLFMIVAGGISFFISLALSNKNKLNGNQG